ncbi:ECF-type sigma factor [Dokdonella sp.]|uniref:ECF-type sigma factor n=1 Tax=Dokdonella sp. TaxID=2291710 RepID=UPI0031C4114C|nr:ECF-type sigma factor [Dokdonella sp.]
MTGIDERDLFAAAYAELHRIARRERRRAHSPATINTTALVHETWFKLRPRIEAACLTRGAFLAIAARAMRQVLVDHARKLNAEKRRHMTVTLGRADTDGPASASPVAMLELDSALCRLADIDAQLARIVDLHVFSGLEFAEIADLEGLSERSVFRLWRNARVFLLDQLAA